MRVASTTAADSRQSSKSLARLDRLAARVAFDGSERLVALVAPAIAKVDAADALGLLRFRAHRAPPPESALQAPIRCHLSGNQEGQS
jgi:hypothetical protein